MAKTFGPNLGLLADAAQGEAHYPELMKQWRGLDALVMPVVKGLGTNAPPGSPADGDAYVVGTAPTGAWAGQSNKIARWSSVAAAWEFFTSRTGWSVRDGSSAIAQPWFFNGTTWQSINIRLSSGFGLVIPAVAGSTYDLYLQNPAQNAAYMQVLAGSNIPQFPQGINFGQQDLKNYSEGTWTPSLAGTVVAGSHTYTQRVGLYTRIGRLVLIHCVINLSAKDAAMSGEAVITGLPFVPGLRGIGSMTFDKINLGSYMVIAPQIETGNYIRLIKGGSAVGAGISSDSDISSTTGVSLSGFYFL